MNCYKITKGVCFLKLPLLLEKYLEQRGLNQNKVGLYNKHKMKNSIFNLATAKTEIKAANKELITFLTAADPVRISECFTEDAKFMMSGTPSISGKESVKSTFAGLIESGISNLNLNTIEIWGTEDLITEEGEYSLFSGDTKVDHGKFMVLWKKEDGKWKLHRDMISSNVTPVE